jgi:hypothetical protein
MDFYYHAPAKRGRNEEVVALFQAAYAEQPALALLALFNLRDIRGGKGERASFRACLAWLAEHDPQAFGLVAPFVPHYGRWDDLIAFHAHSGVRDVIAEQLRADCTSARPSLLAKWMPSLKASSARTRTLAHAWRKALGMSEQEYRRTLSALRARLRVVEVDMSAGRWGEISYPAVPSRAAMIYRNAFARHDGERYQAFLEAVRAGQAKINAGTLYPYELVHRAAEGDQTIQSLWDALPDYTQERVGLVVADVSGSMEDYRLPRSQARAIDVAIALAIYYAQRNRGPWAEMAITFSARPSVIHIPREMPLHEAVRQMNKECGYNTDFQAIFEMLLGIAQSKKIPPEQMPAAVWVVSDMEFDQAGHGTTNLEAVREKYTRAGYPMPVLVFWDVASRGLQTPALADQEGVVLVSGFSPSAFQAALENQVITPHQAMLRTLFSPRYAPLAERLGLTAPADAVK